MIIENEIEHTLKALYYTGGSRQPPELIYGNAEHLWNGKRKKVVGHWKGQFIKPSKMPSRRAVYQPRLAHKYIQVSSITQKKLIFTARIILIALLKEIPQFSFFVEERKVCAQIAQMN